MFVFLVLFSVVPALLIARSHAHDLPRWRLAASAVGLWIAFASTVSFAGLLYWAYSVGGLSESTTAVMRLALLNNLATLLGIAFSGLGRGSSRILGTGLNALMFVVWLAPMNAV